MRSLHVLLAIGTALAVLSFSPVQAKWPENQRREYVGSCMQTCQSGDASSGGMCDTYCL